VWCVVTDVSVNARLTVKPSNTAALVGSKVVLQCATSTTHDPPRIAWTYRLGSMTPADIVYTCAVRPAYTSQYSVNNNEPGRCDLVINETTLDMAGEYTCVGLPDQAIVQLTVIGESLVLIVCLQQFVSFHFVYCGPTSFLKTPSSSVDSCNIPQFTSLLSRLCPDSPGFYKMKTCKPEENQMKIRTDTYQSATYDFLLTFHSNHGPISYVSKINGDFSRISQYFLTSMNFAPR